MRFSLLLSRRIYTRSLPLARTYVTGLRPKKFRPGRFAFAFDIDGVLLRGSEPHPSANKALTKLQENDIPFILLTNGGGLSEAARCEDLSSKLDFPIAPSQLIQSHTPTKSLAKDYETILVIGGEGENCRQVAEGYGFKNVFIPDDFYATDPNISPFSTSPPPIYARNVPKGTKIDAIFVFNDPRDWALSIQLLVDLLRSADGVYGTLAEPGSKGHVPIFFTNNDLVWANQYDTPRLGQGAFRAAVWAIFQRFPEAHKNPARSQILGKPTHETFRYAQKLLIQNLIAKLKETSPELEFNEEMAALEPAEAFKPSSSSADTSADTAVAEEATPPPPADLIPAATPAGESSPSTEAETANQPLQRPFTTRSILQRVYMIGDNPDSDMIGLKGVGWSGTTWWGLLVRSGVWREPQAPKYPIAIVDDVLAAVDWAMENEQKINDGVELEMYPRYLHKRNIYPRSKGKTAKRYTPGKAGAEEAKGGENASLEKKPNNAMEETKGNGALGKKRADRESSSDSD
ncbi:HAD-like domain-containing protein [Tuber borchii]|uniref:HAD-like domain-containing protein n=1 Tax=Tuber borchii TaxID=42251 RepID=A0A2T6ZEW6_TUBBO|nr:HAD-like domain-containing protein [Tuber borchii]